MSLNKQEFLNSLGEGNKPSEYDGVKGYWCQADCVFIPADDPAIAIQRYRRSFPSGSSYNIAVNHNHSCDYVQYIKSNSQFISYGKEALSVIDALRIKAGLNQDQVDKIWDEAAKSLANEGVA